MVTDLYIWSRQLLWTVAALLRKEGSRSEAEHSLHTLLSFVVFAGRQSSCEFLCLWDLNKRRRKREQKREVERVGLRERIRRVMIKRNLSTAGRETHSL